jgi:hypothetical protein
LLRRFAPRNGDYPAFDGLVERENIPSCNSETGKVVMAEPLPLPPRDPDSSDGRHIGVSRDERQFFIVLTVLSALGGTFLGVGLLAPYEDSPARWYWGLGYDIVGVGFLAMTVLLFRTSKPTRRQIGQSSSRWWLYLGVLTFLLGLWPIVQWFSGGDTEPAYITSFSLMCTGVVLAVVSAGAFHAGFFSRLRDSVRLEAIRLAILAAAFTVIIVGLNTYSLREDFNDFVKPSGENHTEESERNGGKPLGNAELMGSIRRILSTREISERQATFLRNYILQYPGEFAVTVKVNPLDEEALRYAGQIYSALRQTSWTVDFSTADADPRPGNGVNYLVTGASPQLQNSRQTPSDLLQAAFRSAGITINGGGTQGAGDYKMFVIVGHRPLTTSPRLPLLFRLGSWLAHLAMPGAPL